MPNKDMNFMGKENIQQWIKEVLLLGEKHKTILDNVKVRFTQSSITNKEINNLNTTKNITS